MGRGDALIGPLDPLPAGAPFFFTSRGLRALLMAGRVHLGDALARRVIVGLARPVDRPPWHMGILVGPDEVVHLTAQGVRSETVHAFARGERVYRLAGAQRPAAAIAVARRRVGERGTYRVLGHNCVDFVTSCVAAQHV